MLKLSFVEAIKLIDQTSRTSPSLTQDLKQFSLLTQRAIAAFNDRKYLLALALKNEAIILKLEKYLHDSLGIVDALEAELESLDCEERTANFGYLATVSIH